MGMLKFGKHSTLSYACAEGILPTVKRLLRDMSIANAKKEGKNSWSLLHWSQKCGHHEISKFLIDMGFDLNSKYTTPNRLDATLIQKPLYLGLQHAMSRRTEKLSQLLLGAA